MKTLSFIFVILLSLISISIPPTVASLSNRHITNDIVEENQRLGTTDWQIEAIGADQNWDAENHPSPDLLSPRAWTDSRATKGYASEVSINHGESIDFHVSTTQSSYNIDVYRIGWYGGAGGRWVTGVQGLTGQNHGVPSPDPTTGMIEATWPVAYTLNTTTSWVSGVYLARLTASNGQSSYIIFIVRNDSSTSDIMFQIAITTYQAYNNWGGKSLYDFNSDGGRANKVSFDRPYELWSGAGYFFQGDYTMIRWLEREGYDVSYAASTDVETNPNLMNNHRVFLSNYHDEYWSMTMRQNITAVRDAGKDLAFFTSNNIYWQIRYESSTSGEPNRVMVCYKEAALDPMSTSGTPELTTVRWREAPVNMPENELLGVMYYADFGDAVTYDYVVQNASHWLYDGTGLQNGDHISEVVGDEYDNVWNNGLTPENLIVLSSSPVADGGTSNASIYTADSGALVFDASTNRWALKLDDTDYDTDIDADANMQQMTRNLLNQMIGLSPTPVYVPSIIYDDGLAFEWSDNNSAAYTNYANPTPVYAGTRSIAHSPSSSSNRISIKLKTPVSTIGYTDLRIAVRGTQTGQQYTVQFWTQAGQPAAVNLNNYGGAIVAGSWKVYDIPLEDMGGANANITYLWIRPTGGTINTAYFDEIALVAGPPNAPPVAFNDSYSVNEDGTLNVNATTGALDNDTDAENDSLTALPIGNASNGSATLNSDGSFTYTPNGNFNGSDSFTYQAYDGTSNSNTATVTITVNAVNDAPDFSHQGDQTIPSGTTQVQTVANWAYDFNFGPPDEAGQSVSDFLVSVTADPNDIFTTDPDVANNGTLTYIPNGTNGTTTISVQLRDSGGTGNGGQNTSTVKTFTITVETPPPPIASFTVNITGLTVNFTDTSTNTPTAWAWNFDDTNTSTAQNPSHTYDETGTYNVCLTASNVGGSDQFCHEITVTEPPTADFDFLVNGLNVTFTDDSTDTPTSWLWDFGDSTSSTLQNPSHLYSGGGTYNVCLTATNTGGSDQDCQDVTVVGPPVVDFTFVTDNLSVNFTDTSTSSPTTWAWNFGDSTSSTGQHPSHLYAAIGTYNVCLVASNASGSAQKCKNVSVNVGAPNLVSPIGTISVPAPDFLWSHIEGTTWYHIYVGNAGGKVLDQWYQVGSSSISCGGGTCTLTSPLALANQAYTWYVQGYGLFGYTSWTGPGNFTVNIPAPDIVSKTYPANGSTINQTEIEFTWNADNNATWYLLWLSDGTNVIHNQWYSSATVCTSNCSHDLTLPIGNYTWAVQAYGPAGYSDWGSNFSFSIVIPIPGIIVKTAPLGVIGTTTPTFTWENDAASTWYQVWVGNSGGTVYVQSHSVSTICIGATCSLNTGLTFMGDYTWYVRGWSPGGYGDWGSSSAFSVVISVPEVIVKTAPIGAIGTPTPMFIWESDTVATWYEIWIGNAGGTVYQQWHSTSTICVDDTCSLNTGLTFIGDYTWYVRGWSPGGYGDWGIAAVFSYAIILNSPSGTVSGIDLTYNWVHLGSSTTWYRLWVGLNGVSPVIDQWIQASSACDATTCSFDDPSTRPVGNYIWYVQPYGTYGYGAWSAGKLFSVSAGFAELDSFTIVESDDPLVSQAGDWRMENVIVASGGSYLVSSGNIQDTLTLEFDGSYVEIIFDKQPSFGIFAIEIDNTIYRTVVSTSDNVVFDNRATIDYLDNGHHALRIYPVEGVIAIDAFVVSE